MSAEGLEFDIKDPCVDCIYRDSTPSDLSRIIFIALATSDENAKPQILPGCRHPWRYAQKLGLGTSTIVEVFKLRDKNPDYYKKNN